jgi:Icc-related predicted phosphoesterase
MANGRVTRIICAADPRGSAAAVEQLLEAEPDADALALVGDLGGGDDRQHSYQSIFKALAEGRRPAYWVPGPADAPVEDYLREAANIEIVRPDLRGVHGTAALGPDGHVVFAGIGGEVSDDPEAAREERERLRYARWEAEYRLKVINELDEHQLVLLFSTRPAHKGHDTPGSEALAELIATYRARLAVSPGDPASEVIGRSLIVTPGSLAEGSYAVADLSAHDAELKELAASPAHA